MESLQEHPQQPGKILIGYSRGLVVLWDLAARHTEQLFLGKQVSSAKYTYAFLLFAVAQCTSFKVMRFSMYGACLFVSVQQLESLVWERTGNLFVSSHNDGGYSVWAVTNGNTCSQQPTSSTIPYGEEYMRTCIRSCIL